MNSQKKTKMVTIKLTDVEFNVLFNSASRNQEKLTSEARRLLLLALANNM